MIIPLNVDERRLYDSSKLEYIVDDILVGSWFSLLVYNPNPLKRKETSTVCSSVSRTISKNKLLVSPLGMASKLTTTTSSSKLSPVQPDLGMVQEVASLLNVKVDTGTNQKLVDTDRTVVPNHSDTATTPHHHDIRAKYANKLKHGLAGLELAKSQVNEALARGDAPGHLAARKLAQEQPPTQSSQARWLAMTGVGKLLSYLTHRSIRIALLSKSINPQMAELAKQLKNDVVIDVLMDGPRRQEAESAQQSVTSMETLVKQLLEELDKDAQATMLVSDRDDFLKAARDLGMITCQYRPGKNARRGNVTCSYTATSIDDIQGVINEINGISFNAVLNR